MTVYIAKTIKSKKVKIGFSGNPEGRIYRLSSITKEKLELIRLIDGDRRTERWFHKKFANEALGHEWFTYNEEMLTIEPPIFKGKPRCYSTTVAIPNDLRDRIEKEAHLQRRSLSAQIVLTLKKAFPGSPNEVKK